MYFTSYPRTHGDVFRTPSRVETLGPTVRETRRVRIVRPKLLDSSDHERSPSPLNVMQILGASIQI